MFVWVKGAGVCLRTSKQTDTDVQGVVVQYITDGMQVRPCGGA